RRRLIWVRYSKESASRSGTGSLSKRPQQSSRSRLRIMEPRFTFMQTVLRYVFPFIGRNRPTGSRDDDYDALWVVQMSCSIHLSQDPFTLSLVNFHRQRKLPGELDDAMIQERHASLEAYRHTRTVDLGQNVVRQVAQHIQEHHAIECVRRSGPPGTVGQHGWGF